MNYENCKHEYKHNMQIFSDVVCGRIKQSWCGVRKACTNFVKPGIFVRTQTGISKKKYLNI